MKKLEFTKAFDEVLASKSYKKALEVIKNFRFIADREREFGFDILEEKAMGSGGVGQVKIIGGFVYVQIGCGHGRYNYASTVKLGYVKQNELGTYHFVETLDF